MYKYVYVCVYLYLHILNLAGSGFLLSTTKCKEKKKNPEYDPSINNKTPCPKPNP